MCPIDRLAFCLLESQICCNQFVWLNDQLIRFQSTL